MMESYIGWIASAATMIAALMTAANLGTRVTGWGFVVFSAGSLAWTGVGMMSGQTSLAITNGFLLLVNLFGIWRWLVWQARHETGSASASARSARFQQVPTLISGGSMIGAKLCDPQSTVLGKVVDAMFDCETQRLGYIVISQGGLAGAGETLRAIASHHIDFTQEAVRCKLLAKEFAELPPINPDAWPASAPEAEDNQRIR